jgi:cysteinylglycine-S-conjugate dipeptidase
MTAVALALQHLETSWSTYLAELEQLVRIPGISAEPPPSPQLERSAAAVADLFQRIGFDHSEVIAFDGGHPYVYADWLHAPGAPTVLLYGHHDVQPPGRPEAWETPPFEPALRDDGRMYGRGVVDDKAGVMMHVAACAAYLRASGGLPINVKFIVEGEEEAGSKTLSAFLERYQQKLQADVIVLSDTANLDAGIPSLTCSLRGIAAVHVKVRALEHPLHSGMWGGPIPDPVIALCKAIGALTDESGKLLLDVWDQVRPLTGDEKRDLHQLPFDEAAFRNQATLVPGAALVGDASMPVWGRVWRQPSVSVIALEARPIAGSSNQIIDTAQARVSVRVVPDQDPVKVQDALVAHFERHVPWGLSVDIEREDASGWWVTHAEGPAFDAARRALEQGYGRKAETIGCGGSIPFVEPFARVLGGAPALLLGLEDPICNAHAENESLNLDDWKRGTRSAVYLYEELSKLAARPLS